MSPEALHLLDTIVRIATPILVVTLFYMAWSSVKNILPLLLLMAVTGHAQELLVGGEYRLYPSSGVAHICRIQKWLKGSYYEANERAKQLPVWGPAECVDSKGNPRWPVYIWKKETEIIDLDHYARIVLIRKPNGDKPDKWSKHVWNTPWIPPSERSPLDEPLYDKK